MGVALAIDLAIQALAVVTISLVQLIAEVNGSKLPLESSPLMQLSQERCELFYKVFYKYEPPNTLIQIPVECNTEDLIDQDVDLEHQLPMGTLCQNLRSPESSKHS